mmetsp:Transcript_12329/g.33914  ORF Transcript_12329/g.33914 Transcript_12329/m.33914 type:complete len:285 (+) Transcript_12329:132-986(+)
MVFILKFPVNKNKATECQFVGRDRTKGSPTLSLYFNIYRQADVDEPQGNQTCCAGVRRCLVASKLSSEKVASSSKEQETTQRATCEDSNTRTQSSCDHNEPSIGIVHTLVRIRFFPLFRGTLKIPVKGTYGPREAEPQKNVHRVAPCHVADTSVCVGVLLCGCLRCEGVWQRSPKSDKCDGGNRFRDAHRAAKQARHVPNQGGNKADHAQRREKTKPTVQVVARRHDCEHKFPRKHDEVHNPVKDRRLFQTLPAATYEDRLDDLVVPVRVANLHLIPVELHGGY